jgi:hypothetical protein
VSIRHGGRRNSCDDPRNEYSIRLNARNAALTVLRRQHRALGNARLALFVVTAAMIVAAFGREAFSAWWLTIPAAAFIGLGARLRRLESRGATLSRAVEFYERALARLDGDWAGKGATGARFLDEHHLYARDLDILGEASLFELLCNARTSIGEETLAAWLLNPAPPGTVTARQQAILELAPRLDLREDCSLAGDHARSGVDAERLIAWGEREPVLVPSSFRTVVWSLSIAGAIAATSAIAYLAVRLGILALPESTMTVLRIYFLSIGAICLAVAWRFEKRTARIIQDVDKAGHDLGLLVGLLHRLEREEFDSPYLMALRAQLVTDGPASQLIGRLNMFVEMLNFRRNDIMKLLGLWLLWTLQVCYFVEDWRRMSGPAIRRWLNAVGEIEALASLAGYCYEHPRSTFPEFVTASPFFEAEALGHPLLTDDRVVPNDTHLGHDRRVLVVSGSNMSGKSTLLRTIGTNAVLAQAGAPVCASRLLLSSLTVGASIRIEDSLQEGTSRFYAEISRLSRIMAASSANPPVLFLIDEFLNGTNSHDRLIGAEAIVRGLVDRGAIGLITTHDLALTHIATALGSRGANVHFQDYLENGQMRFDYRIRPGIVQHSNALALMRSVGLEV